MKKILLLGLSLFIMIPIIIAQNIIKNPSFENGDANKPTQYGGISSGECDEWEGAGATSQSASPDWFRYPTLWIQETVGGSFMDIPAAEGLGYAGMLPNEMIQISIPFSESDTARRHNLKFKIRLPQGIWKNSTESFGNPNWIWDNSDNTTLDVYVAKTKIGMDNPTCGSGGADPVFTGDPIMVERIPVTLSAYPTGVWHQIETGFVMPDFEINWIGLILRNNDCLYLLLDDFEMSEISCQACELDCDPVDGCISPLFLSTAHNKNDPFSVSGLQNVSYLKIEIAGVLGGVPFRTIEVNNPNFIVSWDGKNDLGIELAAGIYFYTVILGNNCERKRYVGQIFKANSPNGNNEDSTAFNPLTMTYESFLKLDIVGDPCCEECIIIDGNTQDYIDPPMTIAELGSENTLIGTYEISAIDSIKIDKHIFFTVGSNITFKAGKEILFEDTMNIFEGAEIEAIIVDCPPGFAENTIVAIPAVGRISSNTFQAVKKSVSTLMVTPNPSTGVVKFILPENKHRSNIQVIDIKGRILNNILLEQGVEQYWIDLSHYNSGIYIVKYITNGTTISRKIVLK